MGLKLTLPKERNHLYHDFDGAYWSITSLSYDVVNVMFTLSCHESRDAKMINGFQILEPSLDGFGSSIERNYKTTLFEWSAVFEIESVFPEGIPLGRDAQLTQIYNFIKDHTGLPFEDVFEDAETEAEPAHEEPVVQDPESQTVEDPVEEPETEAAPETEPEPEYDPLHL